MLLFTTIPRSSLLILRLLCALVTIGYVTQIIETPKWTLGFSTWYSPMNGFKVTRIEPGGPASDTDLLAGEWITGINGQALGRFSLYKVTLAATAQERVGLTVKNTSGRERAITVITRF